MPYEIIKLRDSKYKVKNAKTGDVLAKGTTKEKAKNQVRLLNAIEHGYKPGMRNY